jgi:hypothetical protein
MIKLKVEKKTMKTLCWVCKGKKCKACHNTGMWEESIYYHIITDKNGNKYCVDGDTIK